MIEVVVEHRFERVSVERFVDVYYSDAFNRAVAPLAGMAERVPVLEEVQPDGRILRRVRMVPDVRLPGPVQKLLQGARVEYFERSLYDPQTHEAEYEIESEAGDHVQVKGKISFVDDGQGGVRRIIAGGVKVKAFGLGGLIERLIAREVESRYTRIQAFTQKWIDEHPEEPGSA